MQGQDKAKDIRNRLRGEGEAVHSREEAIPQVLDWHTRKGAEQGSTATRNNYGAYGCSRS